MAYKLHVFVKFPARARDWTISHTIKTSSGNWLHFRRCPPLSRRPRSIHNQPHLYLRYTINRSLNRP